MQIELVTKRLLQSVEFHIVNSPLESLELHQNLNDTLYLRKSGTPLANQINNIQNQFSKDIGLNNYVQNIPKDKLLLANPRRNCVILNYDSSFYIDRGCVRIIDQPINTCVTAMIVISNDIIAYSTDKNEIFIMELKTEKILQKLETKTWIYSLSKIKTSQYNKFVEKHSTTPYILKNPIKTTMSQCGILLVAGTEKKILVWDSNFSLEQQYQESPIMQLQNESYFRGLSILDLEDEQNIIVGDSKGFIYLWDINTQKLVFKLDTQGKQVNKLATLKNKNLFISGHQQDFDLGGIIIWRLIYQNNQLIDCVMQKRLKQASNINSVIPLIQNNRFIISSESNELKVYDIEEGKYIRTLVKGETDISDCIIIENKGGTNHYFIVVMISQSVIKIVDSNEFQIAQFQFQDDSCCICQDYFKSHKINFIDKNEGKIRIMFQRHQHNCTHQSVEVNNKLQDINEKCYMQSSIYIQELDIKMNKDD